MAKIMLVEDDNNLRQIYEDRLAAEGYTIVSAKDGEEALALAVKERPDLIIADIMMPKVSGFDMLDILRSTPETKDTKIIMMTALSQAEDKDHAEKLGADRYLVKSQVTLEDVARVAGEMLQTQQAATDSAVSQMTGDSNLATPSASSAPAPTTTAIPVAAPPAEPTTSPAPAPAPDSVPPSTPPAVTPTAPAVSIPITSAPDDTTTSAQAAPASKAAADLGTPIQEEKKVMNEQIDDFIASNPTLSSSPTVVDEKPVDHTAVTSPEEPAATAPEAPPTVESKPDPKAEQAGEKISVTVNAPKNEESAAASAPETPPTLNKDLTDDQTAKVASAVDGLLKEAGSDTSGGNETPDTTSSGVDKSYVSAGSPSEGANSSMTHGRKIEPLTDVTNQPPSLNELLAKEAEHQHTPPPVSSVITPEGVVSSGAHTSDTSAPATGDTITPTGPPPEDDIAL